LYADSVRIARTFDWSVVKDALQTDVEMFLAIACRDRIFVHAGVVGLDGKAIVIPGRSGSGKTTLVQAFIRAGAQYFSDEYAVVDPRGRVHAFPRQPVVRRADGTRHRQSPDSGRFENPRRPLPLGLVAVVPYDPAARFRARDISPARGALEMMKNAPAARRRPDMMLEALTRAASGARSVQGTRGDADSAVEALRRML
jgi:ABC-type ATPase with predicted acetyltransferase domain